MYYIYSSTIELTALHLKIICLLESVLQPHREYF